MSPRPTPPLILGIESSCDDTACAVVDGTGAVLASVVSSQLAHRAYGGVVPELASREHLVNWPEVSRRALDEAGSSFDQLGGVAATFGPGLVGSLLVGLSLGKAIAYALSQPFHAVHHLEGHLYSPFLGEEGEPAEPIPDRFVGLIVSGGHTSLVRVRRRAVDSLGETRDDAMGEAFDKIGKRLGLPFPGGPHLDAWAELAEASLPERPSRGPFRIARCGDTLDFSYSGLKTRMLHELARLEREGLEIGLEGPPERDGEPQRAPPERLLELVASFRCAAVDQLLDRVARHHRAEPIPCLAISGGVAANRLLRRRFEAWAASEGVELRLARPRYAGDNAAMIAFAGLLRQQHGESDDPRSAEATSRAPLGTRGVARSRPQAAPTTR